MFSNPFILYTRLLVGSIPAPKPDRLWAAEAAPAFPGQQIGHAHCKFACRCPAAMTKYLQQTPPLYQTEAQRAAACFLYEDAPTLSNDQMDSVFRTK